MVYYETGSRLQLAREHADRPAAEMRRSRRLTPDEAGFFSRARLAPAQPGQSKRLRRRRGHHTPAYDA
jgi:hypothetical protein